MPLHTGYFQCFIYFCALFSLYVFLQNHQHSIRHAWPITFTINNSWSQNKEWVFSSSQTQIHSQWHKSAEKDPTSHAIRSTKHHFSRKFIDDCSPRSFLFRALNDHPPIIIVVALSTRWLHRREIICQVALTFTSVPNKR